MGRGAVLFINNTPREYCIWKWDDTDASHLGVKTGIPDHQSFWEFLTVGLALCEWATTHASHTLSIQNDNLSALQQTLDLKGRGPMLEIAREIAWRKAKFRWAFEAAHLPSEVNVLADKLSRLHAPEAASVPSELKDARRVTSKRVRDFWQLDRP